MSIEALFTHAVQSFFLGYAIFKVLCLVELCTYAANAADKMQGGPSKEAPPSIAGHCTLSLMHPSAYAHDSQSFPYVVSMKGSFLWNRT